MRGRGLLVRTLVAFAFPPAAFAQTPDLTFARDPALPRCPDEGAFRAMMRQHRVMFAEGDGDPRPESPAVTRVDVRYLRDAQPGRVRLEVRTFDGPRELSAQHTVLREAACAQDQPVLAAQLEFVTRPSPLAVPRPPASPIAPPAPTPAPPASPAPSTPPPATAPRTREQPAARPLRALVLGGLVGGGITAVSVPAVEANVLFGLSLHGARWQLRATAVLGAHREVPDAAQVWMVQRWSGDVSFCYMVFAWWGVCAGVQVGALDVSASTSQGIARTRTVEAAAVGRLLFEHRVAGPLWAWANLDGIIQLLAYDITVNDGSMTRSLWSSPGAGVSLAAGAAVRFW